MIQLKPHQEEAYRRISIQKKLCLYWSTGSGKTLFGVFLGNTIWNAYKRRTLFVTPVGAFKAFRDAEKELCIPSFSLDVIDSAEKYEDLKNGKIQAPMVVINYEKFRLKSFIHGPPLAWRWKPEEVTGIIRDINPIMVFFDESHSLKSAKATQSKKAQMTNALNIPFMICASGTMMGKDQRDLFAQMLVVDNGDTFGKSPDAFESRYFYKIQKQKKDGTMYPSIELRKDRKEEFDLKIKPFMSFYKLPKSHLPQKNSSVVPVDLTDKQADIYRKILKERVLEIKEKQAEIKSGHITHQQYYLHILSVINALRQICCGFYYYNVGGLRRAGRVPTKKLDVLADIISKQKFVDKTIIWTVYVESFNILEDFLRSQDQKFVTIRAGEGAKRRQLKVKQFQEDPYTRFFIAHPKSGGVGLNLQQAKTSIYFSQEHSFIGQVQSEGRNNRIGSLKYHKEIQYYYLRTRGTVETDIRHSLKKKKDVVEDFEKYLEAV